MQRGRLKADMYDRAQWWNAELKSAPSKGTERARVQYDEFAATTKHSTAHRAGQRTVKYFHNGRQTGLIKEMPNGELRFYVFRIIQ